MVHDRTRVGVGEEVPQLVGTVAVVHVHRDRSQLERGEHRLEVLGAVVQEETHVVARADPTTREMVRESRRASVELREREPPVLTDQRFTVGNRVRDEFEEVGEVVVDAVPAVCRSGDGSGRR